MLALGGLWLNAYWLALGLLPLFGLYLLGTRPLLYFWALLALLPLSFEFYLGSIGTDLPTEPIMILLTGYFILHGAYYWQHYDHRFYRHPISLLVLIHFAWIFVSALFGQIALVSWKYTLAKFWYIVPFYFLAGRVLDRPERIRKMAWLIFIPLLFVAFQSIVRHAGYNFSYSDQFRTLSPFMRNHVNYAGMLAAFAPWLAYLIWHKKRHVLLWAAAVFGIIAIYFSYTRAAYVSLILAGAAWFVIKRGWLKPLMAATLATTLAGSIYLIKDNNYLEYAPNFETTVSYDRFDNLISATYKLEDISTMERAYRWVAAGHMVPYHPYVGWGPGNFRFHYKGYAVTSFQTYVSDNPEQSGIHNYFLMTLVEQGYPGLVILVALLLLPLAWAQTAYKNRLRSAKTRGSYLRKYKKTNRLPEYNAILMAAMVSQIVIIAFQLINDMLETDKMGSLFWLNLAIMTNFTTRLGDDGPPQPDRQNAPHQAEQ